MISSRPALPAPAPDMTAYTITAPEGEESAAGGMSIAQIVCILRAYWRHSVVAVIALMLVSFGAIKLLPKSYAATATLIVNFENKDPLAGREFVGGGGNTYIPTQIELIMSQAVLGPVVERLKLTSDPEFTRGFSGSPAALKEVVVRNLRDKVQVQQGVSSQLLYITVSGKAPERVAELANSVADEYLRQQRQRTNGPAAERAERYSRQLAELRAKAIAAQDRVTEFRQQNGMTEVGAGQGDIEGAALSDLQQKLEAAQNQRRELESRQISGTASSDVVLETASIVALRAKLGSLEGEMAEARTTLGPKHPKAVELQSQIDATRRSLAAEVQSISANSSVQLQRARDLEAKYQAAITVERTRLLQRRGLQDEEAKLLLELQSAQATYKKGLDGYDQIVFASSGNYSDVSLVSRADPPPKPDKPNKPKWFAIACLFSLGLGVAGPFGYELFLNRRLRCRDDLEKHFGMSVLAQLGPLPSLSN
ncbi:MAG: GumC family protein [Steroidobacteraceae bacterium]